MTRQLPALSSLVQHTYNLNFVRWEVTFDAADNLRMKMHVGWVQGGASSRFVFVFERKSVKFRHFAGYSDCGLT